MYTETLSPSFIGMSFAQAAETCFVKVLYVIFIRALYHPPVKRQ